MATAVWLQENESIQGSYRTGWSVRNLDCIASSFIFEAFLRLETAQAAGFALRMSEDMHGSVIAIDREENVVFFAEAPDFDFTERRQAEIVMGQTYHLRVVQRLEHLEVYLDDVLKLAFPHYRCLMGELGLFVDRGRCIFSKVRIRTLDVTKNRTAELT